MYLIIVIGLFFLFRDNTMAQLKGNIRDERFQVDCMIPDGWIAERTEYGMQLRSEQPGCNCMMVVFLNSVPSDSVIASMKQGFDDGNGTELILSGTIEPASGGYEAHYTGMVDWQPSVAAGYARIVSGSNACIILAASSERESSDPCRAVARDFLIRVAFHSKETESLRVR